LANQSEGDKFTYNVSALEKFAGWARNTPGFYRIQK
jgi:hypothetical protein